MKNFIFKSASTDLHKMLFNKLDMILAEQRHARSDLAYIIRAINRIAADKDLQKQVDEYFENPTSDPPEDAEPD